MKEMCQLYEIVVFTDSMGGLADEVNKNGRDESTGTRDRYDHSQKIAREKWGKCRERSR